MKHLMIALLCVSAFAFTGCSADDLAGLEATAPSAQALSPNTSLVGVWKAIDDIGVVSFTITKEVETPVFGSSDSPRLSTLEGVANFESDGAPSEPMLGGTLRGDAVSLQLLNAKGTVVATAEGQVGPEFSFLKIVLRETGERDRFLRFSR